MRLLLTRNISENNHEREREQSLLEISHLTVQTLSQIDLYVTFLSPCSPSRWASSKGQIHTVRPWRRPSWNPRRPLKLRSKKGASTAAVPKNWNYYHIPKQIRKLAHDKQATHLRRDTYGCCITGIHDIWCCTKMPKQESIRVTQLNMHCCFGHEVVQSEQDLWSFFWQSSNKDLLHRSLSLWRNVLLEKDSSYLMCRPGKDPNFTNQINTGKYALPTKGTKATVFLHS